MGFWSKQVQKHDFWTRNEGDITDLNKSPISHSVLVQKLWFWTRFKADRSGFHDPYPYPHLPIPVTHMGSKTCDIPYQLGGPKKVWTITEYGLSQIWVEAETIVIFHYPGLFNYSGISFLPWKMLILIIFHALQLQITMGINKTKKVGIIELFGQLKVAGSRFASGRNDNVLSLLELRSFAPRRK